MITTRTPLRISLVGGGTDVAEFYRKYGGCVVSFTINHYVYISINPKFDGRTRVSYSETETVNDPQELKHDLVREALKLLWVRGVEITSVSDIPGSGTGLGSSSSFTVGLLAALSEHINGRVYPRKIMAETAYTIESHLCKHAGVGKQDHYAASFGGLHYYQFNEDDTVSVEPICANEWQKKYMEDNFLLLYTGVTRSSESILRNQADNLRGDHQKIRAANEIKDLAFNLATEMQAGDFSGIGDYLQRGWFLKRGLSDGITNNEIDRIHAQAMESGAVGGKILGAGGGGFFLFFAPPEKHKAICESTGLKEVPFKFDDEGTKVIYDSKKPSVR